MRLVNDIAVERVDSAPEGYSYIGIKRLTCDGDGSHGISAGDGSNGREVWRTITSANLLDGCMSVAEARIIYGPSVPKKNVHLED